MNKVFLAAAVACAVGGCNPEPEAATGNGVAVVTNNATQAERSARRQREPRGFLRADANGDRVVTRDEILAEADKRFRSIDTDGDGIVSSSKLSGRRARAIGRGDSAALSRPGRPVTLKEHRERALARFDRRDVNDDGRLAGDELAPRVRRRAAP